MILPKRIWKDIIVDDTLTDYEISSDGRVRNKKTKKLLKLQDDKDGYKIVSLHRPRRKFRVHRLVAIAFIPNPNNLPYVNHIDEVKYNNIVTNLEWCTVEYNNNYGTRNKRLSEKLKGKSNPYMKENNPMYSDDVKELFSQRMKGNKIGARKVICFNNYQVYDSLKDCAIALDCDSSSLSRVCSGRYKKVLSHKNVYVYAMYYDEFLKILESMEG